MCLSGPIQQFINHVFNLFSVLLVLQIVSQNHVYLASPSSDSEKNIEDFGLDDLLSTLESGVDTLFDYMGEPDGCFYKCKNGAIPIPNSRHNPSSNGCGAIGMMQIDTSIMPAVTKCCDKHDYCYDTCNKKKADCDDTFHNCLVKVCKKLKKVFSEESVEGCKSTADLIFAGVTAVGCKPFKEAQKKACLCPDNATKSNSRRKSEL